MICAWQAYKNLLPGWIREEVEPFSEKLEETRIRVGECPILKTCEGMIILSAAASKEDILHSLNAATHYSPWTSETIRSGYITAQGGHRIGICGQAIMENNSIIGVKEPSSICIRVAKDYPGIAEPFQNLSGSTLIIGAPGWGKTTLLRDLIRRKSNSGQGPIAVIDEKQELFPKVNGESCFPTGIHTDILSGCSKSQGIDNVLKNMGPRMIAMDEITSQEDCDAVIHAGWCGVHILATAHAASRKDLETRSFYQAICQIHLFDNLITLHADRTMRVEQLWNSTISSQVPF